MNIFLLLALEDIVQGKTFTKYIQPLHNLDRNLSVCRSFLLAVFFDETSKALDTWKVSSNYQLTIQYLFDDDTALLRLRNVSPKKANL